MEKKKSTTIFIIFAIIVFIAATVSSVIAANEGKQCKAANAAYSLYVNDTNIVTGNVSAKAESAKKQADEHKTKLIKYFAVSLLLYFALLIMLTLLYMTRLKESNDNKLAE